MMHWRRRKFYLRCQKIIDDLHKRVANGEFVHDHECIKKYGASDYRAFVQELNLMNVKPDWRAMTAALEWMYFSRYFSHKAHEDSSAIIQLAVVVLSLFCAGLSAYCSYILSKKDTNLTIYEADGKYYDSAPYKQHEEGIEVAPEIKIVNGCQQTISADKKKEQSDADQADSKANQDEIQAKQHSTE